jgi:microsomal dipeptidase-like Zn-dependent dipeptidase
VTVDLHAHYPMHLLDAVPPGPVGKFRLSLSWLQRLVMTIANAFFNFPKPTDPAVTVDHLLNSPVRVVLSMLYCPFDEIDFSQKYGAPPQPHYFDDLKDQMCTVEKDLEWQQFTHPNKLRLARNPAELNDGLANNELVFIHAIEGGFHIGTTNTATIQSHVAELADLGVAYITIAHLFVRKLATNAPALPFLDDNIYRLIFPESGGITQAGRDLIEAMINEGILIDVSHMSDAALTDTLDLLDDVDPTFTVPVMATHTGVRTGAYHEYNISDANIQRIANRAGVIGLIFCEHWMATGGPKPATLNDSLSIILDHVQHIHDVTGSHDYTAFGSDLDGFIKPTLPGLDYPSAFTTVQNALSSAYTPTIAENICSGNSLRVLQWWRGHVGTSSTHLACGA